MKYCRHSPVTIYISERNSTNSCAFNLFGNLLEHQMLYKHAERSFSKYVLLVFHLFVCWLFKISCHFSIPSFPIPGLKSPIWNILNSMKRENYLYVIFAMEVMLFTYLFTHCLFYFKPSLFIPSFPINA